MNRESRQEPSKKIEVAADYQRDAARLPEAAAEQERVLALARKELGDHATTTDQRLTVATIDLQNVTDPESFRRQRMMRAHAGMLNIPRDVVGDPAKLKEWSRLEQIERERKFPAEHQEAIENAASRLRSAFTEKNGVEMALRAFETMASELKGMGDFSDPLVKTLEKISQERQALAVRLEQRRKDVEGFMKLDLPEDNRQRLQAELTQQEELLIQMDAAISELAGIKRTSDLIRDIKTDQDQAQAERIRRMNRKK